MTTHPSETPVHREWPSSPFSKVVGFYRLLPQAPNDPFSHWVLPTQAHHLNVFGGVHGGVYMSLADVAMATSAREHVPEMGVVTVELKTSFVRAASGPLHAVGQLLHQTATLAFTDCRITDAQGRLCVHATGTFKYIASGQRKQQALLARNATPDPQAITWLCMPFESLSAQQVYDMLRLRIDVFGLEQNCLYQDLDNKDAQAWHVMAYQGGRMVATARLFNRGVVHAHASLGRVLVVPELRGQGFGHRLVAYAMGQLWAQWGEQAIKINAQTHLQAFYEQHGFAVCGDTFNDHGVMHVPMLWQTPAL